MSNNPLTNTLLVSKSVFKKAITQDDLIAWIDGIYASSSQLMEKLVDEILSPPKSQPHPKITALGAKISMARLVGNYLKTRVVVHGKYWPGDSFRLSHKHIDHNIWISENAMKDWLLGFRFIHPDLPEVPTFNTAEVRHHVYAKWPDSVTEETRYVPFYRMIESPLYK